MIGCLPTQALAFEWKQGFSAVKAARNASTRHASQSRSCRPTWAAAVDCTSNSHWSGPTRRQSPAERHAMLQQSCDIASYDRTKQRCINKTLFIYIICSLLPYWWITIKENNLCGRGTFPACPPSCNLPPKIAKSQKFRWNVMFLFSLGSVSTLFRWGGNFCRMYITCFFLFTTVQKL